MPRRKRITCGTFDVDLTSYGAVSRTLYFWRLVAFGNRGQVKFSTGADDEIARQLSELAGIDISAAEKCIETGKVDRSALKTIDRRLVSALSEATLAPDDAIEVIVRALGIDLNASDLLP